MENKQADSIYLCFCSLKIGYPPAVSEAQRRRMVLNARFYRKKIPYIDLLLCPLCGISRKYFVLSKKNNYLSFCRDTFILFMYVGFVFHCEHDFVYGASDDIDGVYRYY